MIAGTSSWMIAGLGKLGRRQPRDINVIVTTAGMGNIGDQALLEACLEHIDGKRVVVVANPASLQVEAGQEVSVLVLPHLVQSTVVLWPPDVRRFAGLLRRACSLTIIGADIMDGSYDPGEAWSRWHLCRLAAMYRVPTRVVSASWSTKADRLVVREAQRATRSASFYVRDPFSVRRVTAAGIAAEAVADVVFASVSTLASIWSEWIAERRSLHNEHTLVLNTSGLIQTRSDLGPMYEQVIALARSAGWSVLLLPHVIRVSDDDLKVARDVLARWSSRGIDDGVRLVDERIRPAEVREIVKNADLVFAGRMHLAIMALNMETPMVVLSTNDKVEGLAAMFGSSELAVSPSTEVPPIIRSVIADPNRLKELKDRICHGLPEVRRLARRQVTGQNPLRVDAR
jgi:polysaccharide pyruvyl transferase WcaK-like protein